MSSHRRRYRKHDSPSSTHGHRRSRSSGRWRVEERDDSTCWEHRTERCENRHNAASTSPSFRGSKRTYEETDRGMQKQLKESERNLRSDQTDDRSKKKARATRIEERLYNMADGSIVMGLYDNERVVLKGKAFIEALRGTLSILGYSVTPGCGKVPVFSTESHSSLVIEAASSSESIPSTTDKSYDADIDSFFESTGVSHYAMLTSLSSAAIDFVTSIPQYKELFKVKNTRSACSQLSELGIEIMDVEDENILLIPNRYNRIAKKLCEALDRGEVPAVCVCGGVDTGKSTLIRFLINSMLAHSPVVSHAECDVGQTEFTPSGTVSLTQVSSPLLGQVSPGDDPDHYIACLKHLFLGYTNLPNKSPLIINTMGWNKGMGVQFLIDTLRLFKPDFVIQLKSSSGTKNYPSLTHEFTTDAAGWLSEAEDLSYEHVEIDSPIAPHKQRGRFIAKDHRDMATLSYLGQVMTSPNQSLLSIKPYEVSWRDVAIHVVHASVPKSKVLQVVNCSIVALCGAEPDNMIADSADQSCCRMLRKTPVTECFGYGLVRAVNAEKNLLYIITPVPPDVLDKVTCLLCGSLTVPQSLILSQKLSDIPYVDNIRDVIGASSVKPRKHMPRKRPPSR